MLEQHGRGSVAIGQRAFDELTELLERLHREFSCNFCSLKFAESRGRSKRVFFRTSVIRGMKILLRTDILYGSHLHTFYDQIGRVFYFEEKPQVVLMEYMAISSVILDHLDVVDAREHRRKLSHFRRFNFSAGSLLAALCLLLALLGVAHDLHIGHANVSDVILFSAEYCILFIGILAWLHHLAANQSAGKSRKLCFRWLVGISLLLMFAGYVRLF